MLLDEMEFEDLNMGEDFLEEDNKLKIQYLGQSGHTPLCLIAIDAILNTGILLDRATIVSHMYNRQARQEDHLFLFWNWGYFPLTVVPSGFSSGRSGGGPHGFSLAICMVRSKGIPLEQIDVSESEFRAIEHGQIDKKLYMKIKAESERFPFPYSRWVLDEDEELLERGRLWEKFFWREPKTDWITEAIADVDIYDPKAGRKLRLAVDKIKDTENVEEWQSTGILIRDAWIELAQKICQAMNIDTSGIGLNDVKGMLGRLELDHKILEFMKSVYDLSQKVQHDRRIDEPTAKACLIATALSMQTLIYHELHRTKKKPK